MAERLVDKLQQDFPQLSFSKGEAFSWSPDKQTVFYADQEDNPQLLHELAHAILNHKSYSRDIELIEMERQAWELAVNELAPRYDIPLSMNDSIVQDSLDTYREWLHQRSVCVNCQAVGLEVKKHHYRCLICNTRWTVNEARRCALRRYKKPL